MIQAGQLDRRVKLQMRVTTRDPMGGEVVTWTDVATIWAGRRDFSGRELIMAASELSLMDTRWSIRWRGDVKAEWRLVEANGTVYDIVSVSEVSGRKALIELGCRRLQP